MNWFFKNLELFGSHEFLIHKEKRYIYDDLSKQIDLYIAIFKKKVLPGEVVALVSDYSFFSISLFLALIKNKNIVAPISSEIEEEINEKISQSEINKKILLIGDGKIKVSNLKNKIKNSLIKDLNSKNKSGLILFSSGSTGKPKAMIHDLDKLIDSFSLKKTKKLTFLVFLMFDHIGGLNTLFNCLAMGSTLIVPESRDTNHICSLIEKYKIQILPASPTFLNLILLNNSQERYDLSSLVMISYGTEPMPESLLSALKKNIPRVKFLQTFGTSETGIAQTISNYSKGTFLKIEDPNLEYKIINNELLLRSKTQILGYLNAPMDRFSNDGWFSTGDLVETNSDGFIKIIGRNQDVINVGGEKVLPGEVETVLLEIPEIMDCLAYPEKNTITGQSVAVKIVVKDKISNIQAKKIISKFCKSKLERFKIPVKVTVVESLPHTKRFKKKRKN